LDAKGGAGGDSFGLGGKLGGADYGPGGGSRFGHYGAMAQAQIARLLRQDDKLANGKYRGSVRVWFTAAGTVSRVEMLHGTGDPELDERIRRVISTLSMSEAPPSGMPEMLIRLDARSS
jgi:TonB family protein